MQFMPKLRGYLKTNKSIYTVRGYNMDHRWVQVEDVGWCERFPLGQLSSLNDLKPYVTGSGFGTLEDWIKAARTFIKPGDPVWLYQVVVRREG